MTEKPVILGIESSCDDTAASFVSASGEILANVVLGQDDLHADFGGVVPELAARAHAEKLDLALEQALHNSSVELADVQAIAVTSGPGLIGGVLAGVAFAKGLALSLNKPLISVNHLAGHALTPRLTNGIGFPYMMLLVSGGHCQFLVAEDADRFQRLGGTIDDAPGEAFDKTAKLLGLGYPGGPLVEKEATQGDPNRFKFPRPLLDRDGLDMSFSGLKSALRRAVDQLVEEKGGVTHTDRQDLCASFQDAVKDVLAQKSARALQTFLDAFGPGQHHFAVAGGVAANQTIRDALNDVATQYGFELILPPLSLCTDNAAMIAWAGWEKYKQEDFADFSLSARPRWPLDQNATPMLGSGKKGAKA